MANATITIDLDNGSFVKTFDLDVYGTYEIGQAVENFLDALTGDDAFEVVL